MIMEMNLRRALTAMGKQKVEVRHMTLSEANSMSDELYVVGLDLAPQMSAFRKVVVIQNMLSTEECIDKLTRAFKSTEKKFRIE